MLMTYDNNIAFTRTSNSGVYQHWCFLQGPVKRTIHINLAFVCILSIILNSSPAYYYYNMNLVAEMIFCIDISVLQPLPKWLFIYFQYQYEIKIMISFLIRNFANCCRLSWKHNIYLKLIPYTIISSYY